MLNFQACEFILPYHWILPFVTVSLAIFVYILVVRIFSSSSDVRRALEPIECDPKKRALRLKQRFSIDLLPDEIDAIVIGSGIGGLSTAAILAKTGRKVLVLEQHDQAGGCCHTFVDQGYEWDVGIHYIGHMAQGDFERYFLDQITEGQLDWKRMEDDFDNVVLVQPDEVVKIPIWSDRRRLVKDLVNRYPQHEKSLRHFFKLMNSTSYGFGPFTLLKVLPTWLAKLVSYAPFSNYKKAFHDETLKTLLDRLFGQGEDEVKPVLSYIFGDYGVEPARSGSGLLALLYDHFTGGAYYPVGGASEIAYSIIPTIEKSGGRVLVNANVTEILLSSDKKEAIGVRVGTSSGPVDIKSKVVISDAGISNTFRRLLPKEVSLNTKIGQLLESGRIHPSLALFQVFVGLKASSEADLELPAKNLWIFYCGNDIDKAMSNWNNLDLDTAVNEAKIPFLFVGFPSAKDPTYNERYPGRSVCTLITTAPMKWFQQWQDLQVKKRGEDYDALKMQLARRCWDLAIEMYPRLADCLDYIDAGSSLSTSYYINAFAGEAYGLEHDTERFAPDVAIALRPRIHEIEGLYLTGQDVLTCGFVGGLFAGAVTATAILPWSESAKLTAGLGIGFLRNLVTMKKGEK